MIFNSLLFSQKETAIIFSEIMFYPSSGITNGEFIELYNSSSTDTFDLAGFKIKYYTSNSDVITDFGSGTKILPKQFAVIFQGNYTSGYTIPANSLKLKISDNSFGTSGMSNTEAREVKLISSKGDTLSSYTYSVPNLPGISDEKIILNNDNSSQNWKNSLVINGTPGAKNSVSPKVYDLFLASIFLNKNNFSLSDTLMVSSKIINKGTNTANNIPIIFSFDINSDSIYEEQEIKVISQLMSQDSIIITANKKIIPISEKFNIKVKIDYLADEDTTNNNMYISFEAQKPDSFNVVINEIMYAPKDDEPEWIELYNNSSQSINIKNWKIGDNNSKSIITKSDFILKGYSFLIVTSNNSLKNFYDTIQSEIIVTSMPVFNNDKDAVVLYSDKDKVIDSVFYYSSWGESGYSLERIDYNKSSTTASNWKRSISDARATPGKINSVVNLKAGKVNSLLINEIMHNPQSFLTEYLEIKNVSSDTINLNGWQLNINDKIYKLKNYELKPDSFFLLSSDSSNISYFNLTSKNIQIVNKTELGLINTNGIVVLLDPFLNTIDSVQYFDNWNNPLVRVTKGRSLERISSSINSNNKTNWSTSTHKLGGTPLAENSIQINYQISDASLNISPNPFSPDNDGFEDFSVFSYNIGFSNALIRIKIFDSKGRLVRTLADHLYTSATGEIIFDGLDENKIPLGVGIYIALLEANNSETNESLVIKKTFVIGKKL